MITLCHNEILSLAALLLAGGSRDDGLGTPIPLSHRRLALLGDRGGALAALGLRLGGGDGILVEIFGVLDLLERVGDHFLERGRGGGTESIRGRLPVDLWAMACQFLSEADWGKGGRYRGERLTLLPIVSEAWR